MDPLLSPQSDTDLCDAVAHARARQAQSRTAARAIALCGTATSLLAPNDGAFCGVLATTSRDWKGV